MYNNERQSSSRNDVTTENDFEEKDELFAKQHLPDVEMEKLRNVIKTKIAGEFMIKLSDLEHTLHLAGQNPTKNTIEKMKQTLDETYHTDEYFLDEIEHILAPYWEELTDEDIAHILIESFQTFDIEEQGSIDKQYLIQNLTTLGEMPLTIKDFQIMFSLIAESKKPSVTFDYHQLVKKICGSDHHKRKTKRKKKKKRKKVKQTMK